MTAAGLTAAPRSGSRHHVTRRATRNRLRVMVLSSRILRVLLAVGGLTIAAGLLFSHQFQTVYALRLVRAVPLPWAFWSACFTVYSVLLLVASRRAAGYIIGYVLFGFFAVAIGLAYRHGHPYDIVGAVAILDVAVFHVAASRLAFDQGAK